MVPYADGVSMTELNVGFLDLSCEHRQVLLCFFNQLTSDNRYEQPAGILGDD